MNTFFASLDDERFTNVDPGDFSLIAYAAISHAILQSYPRSTCNLFRLLAHSHHPQHQPVLSHTHITHTHISPIPLQQQKKKKITNESSTQFRLLAVTVCTFHNSQCLSVCRSIVVHRVCVCICRSPLFFIMHFAYTCSFHQL